MATISSHVLDSIAGSHAAGIRVQLFSSRSDDQKVPLFDVLSNEEGRISEVIDIQNLDADPDYELVFHSAEYFKKHSVHQGTTQIMKTIVVRINLPDPGKRYHIPLVLSPHSYTVWWAS